MAILAAGFVFGFIRDLYCLVYVWAAEVFIGPARSIFRLQLSSVELNLLS